MKYENLKISHQLNIGFGIILLLIIILSIISWQMNLQLARQTEGLYENSLTVRRAISDLKNGIVLIHRDMKELCLCETSAEVTLALQNLENYKANVLKQFEILYRRYIGPIADIDNLHSEFLKWNVIREETRRILREGNKKEAVERTRAGGVGGGQMFLLFGYLEKIDNFSREEADSFYNNFVEVKNSLNHQLLLWVLGILIFTALIIVTITSNIRRPLEELAGVAKDFSEGRTDVRCSNLAANEFGHLAASYNTLADKIETELMLNKQASKLSETMLGEDDARLFCRAVLSELIDCGGAQIGAVYLLNDEKTAFEVFESIGMKASNLKSFSVLSLEGEFGAALASKKIRQITDIADDTHFIFSAVSAEIKPRAIITIPLFSGGDTFAVISLAAVKGFNPNTMRLLETVWSTLSARMDGILTYRKVIEASRLLELQNGELESQKSELAAQANELSEQNTELEMQKKQLDESNRLKTNFLSNMSHELRTPLNSVIALSGVLGRRLAAKVPEEEYGYLEVIERNGKQLLSLINDILDLSRIESGREEFEVEKFDIAELIEEVINIIGPQAKEKNISLACDILPDKNLNICSDYQKCLHIFQNIAANAVKFTEKGGVIITAEQREAFVYICVSDTGIGIDKQYHGVIFEEFRQADGGMARKYGGTGLGLAIAKKYAEILGGDITVESTPGEGSRFTVVLPVEFSGAAEGCEMSGFTGGGERKRTQRNIKSEVKAKAKDKIETGIGIETGTESRAGTGIRAGSKFEIDKDKIKDKTILLVEDNETVIIQMKDILSREGFNIMTARDGEEALANISLKIPDALILDLMMPRVDGFEVLRRIRANEKTMRLPVIILTTKYINKEELAFLEYNDIHQLIQKGNINKDKLLETIFGMMSFKTGDEKIQVKEAAAAIRPARTDGSLPLIFIIEDNADNMLTMKALIEDKCRIIDSAEGGAAAVEIARRRMPDLILMDIALPGAGGIETLSGIRKEIKLLGIPVIAVTASAMKGDHENFIKSGFDGYISKPIDSVIFAQTINKVLGGVYL